MLAEPIGPVNKPNAVGPRCARPVRIGVWDRPARAPQDVRDAERHPCASAVPRRIEAMGDRISAGRVASFLALLAARMRVARAFHTATLLPYGTVLIVGGEAPGSLAVAEPEVFDPATASFGPSSLPLSGPAPVARRGHTATLVGEYTLFSVAL